MGSLPILLLFLGLILGFVLGWLVRKQKGVQAPSGDQFDVELQRLNASLGAKLEERDSALVKAEERLDKAEVAFRQQNESLSNKDKEIATLDTRNKYLQERLESQRKEMEELQERMKLDFENLATKILKTNATEFADSNQKKLDLILGPLKEKIVSFEKQVQEKYLDETKERSKLLEKIDELSRLNQSIGIEAHNLTNALKGDSKAQGNWGELILEKILENSGLAKDREYTLQFSTENVEGKRIQPDVIVNLPDNKHIIIDSKVSLTAYQNYANTEEEKEKENFLKAHILSVRNHIKQLSEKNYPSGKGVNSPDFVLLFMNMEPGFSAALKADNSLYLYAQERHIIIVSPSTLLATLITIASVWKHERQTQNAIEIARQSGSLYDKFVGFIEDLQRIKKGIDTSNDAYDAAMNKLKHGNGNIVGKIERLRKLGAKTTKQIPEDVASETDNTEDKLMEQ